MLDTAPFFWRTRPPRTWNSVQDIDNFALNTDGVARYFLKVI